jgi:7,8-dihydroneopterin aldolase/epimerase/oxygenase
MGGGAMSGRGYRHLLIRDLMLACEIGVFPHEHGVKQRVRINLEIELADGDRPIPDRLADTVSYADIVDGIRRLAAGGRINLVETLAERIADLALADGRARRVAVRVEKLDIYPDAAGVGVAIERFNHHG